MAYDSDDRFSTTRRRFVLEALSGFAGVALLDACGAASEASTTRAHDNGGAGGAAPEGGSGGATTDAGTGGSTSAGTGGSVSSGGGVSSGGSVSSGGAVSSGGSVSSGGVASSGGVNGAGGAVSDAGACALYPQQTEGPFYLDLDLLRADITEGKPGAPLELEITVLSSVGCKPLANALVDVWQCDVDGVYAGFPGQLGGLDTTGLKFLRGTLATDADGKVVFHTIYPGWYPGRTTHIHFKVHLSATTEATSQLYFPEDVTAAVYQAAPYAVRGQKDTSNAMDGIAQSGGMPPLLAVVPGPAGYIGRVTVTVLG